jgi:ComF family protein
LSNRQDGVFDYCAKLARRALAEACVLCGTGATGASRFCTPCFAALPRIERERCRICALPLTSGAVCGACLAEPPHYDAVCAAYAYDFPVAALIHAYKYGGNLSLARVLAHELAGGAPREFDALVPMPLSAARLRERGFNQAHELARTIGRKLRLPVLAHACRKVRDTAPQAALEWSARRSNVRGAFVCDADLAGLRVGVVDDVMTTGATLDELARVLKRAGAAQVRGLVVARTLRGTRRLRR